MDKLSQMDAGRRVTLLNRPVRHAGVFAVIVAMAVALTMFGVKLGTEASGVVRIAIVGLALTGVVHGALDLWISRAAGLWHDRRTFALFHVLYLAVAAAVAACFIFLPVITLIVFVAASLVHFSDDWKPALQPVVRIAGASLLVMIATAAHPGEVAYLFGIMTGRDAPWESLSSGQLMIPLFWLSAGTIAAAFIADTDAGIEIMSLAVLAFLTPPLVSFAIYFACLHSPRHLWRFRTLIAARREKATLIFYAVAAVLLMVMIGGVVGLSHGGSTELQFTQWFRTLFIGLAALTFPHMILLHLAQEKDHSAVR